MEAMSKSSWQAILAFAAALACAAPRGHAQEEPTLAQQIAPAHAAVCQAQAPLCGELKAFAAGSVPCVPEGEHLSVGHAYMIADDGRVEPIEYFVLRTQRASDLLLVQTQHVFSENAQEKEAAEALVKSIAAGRVDEANALYQYLARSGGQAPQLLARPEQGALVVRAEGPVIYLRQSGDQIFAVLPDAVVVPPDSGARRAGLLFAVLPALAACK
jgi:hypothetical protein